MIENQCGHNFFFFFSCNNMINRNMVSNELHNK